MLQSWSQVLHMVKLNKANDYKAVFKSLILYSLGLNVIEFSNAFISFDRKNYGCTL